MIAWIKSLFRRRAPVVDIDVIHIDVTPELIEDTLAEALPHYIAGSEKLSDASEALWHSEQESKQGLAEYSRNAWMLPTDHGARREGPIVVKGPPPDWQKSIEDIQIMALEEVASAKREVNAKNAEIGRLHNEIERANQAAVSARETIHKYAGAAQAAYDALTKAGAPLEYRVRGDAFRMHTVPERIDWLAARLRAKKRRKKKTLRRRV